MKQKLSPKSKKLPLVTIITPTYNRASFLEETILSVLNQDYPNIEYIILDGQSQDNTREVVNKYKEKIIFNSHKNRGEQWAVNKGFRMASGDIIGVVNSDDPLLPGAIRLVVKTLSEYPDVSGVYGDWLKTDRKGKIIEKVVLAEYSYEKMLREHTLIPGPATFYRKKVIEKVKGRDLRFKYVGDFDFILRAGLVGDFKRIPEFLTTFRVHHDAATLKHQGLEMAMAHIFLMNKIFSLPNFPKKYNKIKPEAYAKACEAARICRGNNYFTKLIVFFACLYYSPTLYIKEFVGYRIDRLIGIFSKI